MRVLRGFFFKIPFYDEYFAAKWLFLVIVHPAGLH